MKTIVHAEGCQLIAKEGEPQVDCTCGAGVPDPGRPLCPCCNTTLASGDCPKCGGI